MDITTKMHNASNKNGEFSHADFCALNFFIFWM